MEHEWCSTNKCYGPIAAFGFLYQFKLRHYPTAQFDFVVGSSRCDDRAACGGTARAIMVVPSAERGRGRSSTASLSLQTAPVRKHHDHISPAKSLAGRKKPVFQFASRGNFPYCWRVRFSGMKKKLKWILAAGAVIFGLLQLANPSRTNRPVTPGHDLMASNAPPPEVAVLLHAACYDCHSDETRWPWYSHIAPVSWLVAGDVRDGRERMNFSEWPHDLPARAAKRLERISEEVGYKDMPPGKYTLLHPDARLTTSQRETLINWTDEAAARLKSAATNE